MSALTFSSVGNWKKEKLAQQSLTNELREAIKAAIDKTFYGTVLACESRRSTEVLALMLRLGSLSGLGS